MFGPTRKYRHLAFDPLDDKIPLYWDAHPDGFPVRKGDAPEVWSPHAQNTTTGVIPYAQSKVLEIPKQIDEYTNIMDWIANGLAEKYSEDRRPGKEDGTWFVWITWFDLRGYVRVDGHK